MADLGSNGKPYNQLFHNTSDLLVSDLRLERNQGFPVRVWSLAMCRGEFSAVIAGLMSKYM